jgi:flagellar hook-associated protein 3 FlgL
MRVTNLMNRQRRVAAMLRGQERLDEARERVSSGRRIQSPSDAPNEIAELLRARSEVAGLERRRSAIDLSLPSMRATDGTMGDITGALRQIRTLALQANNGATGSDSHQALAQQVQQLAERIRSLANSEVNGRFLFGGTDTDSKPFAAGPPVTYAGSSRPLELSLARDESFAISVTGDALLNARDGTDLFRSLATLESAIRDGDHDAIAAGLTELDADLDNVLRLRAEIGARIQYVELARERIESDRLMARERQSRLEDADLPGAILEAAAAGHAQEATIAVASVLNRPSLLDYLR